MRRSPSTLARYENDAWTVYTSEDDGVPQMGWIPEHTGGFLRAAPVGSVWVSTTLDSAPPPDGWPPVCNGVAHFDGTTWTQFLGGMYVADSVGIGAPEGRRGLLGLEPCPRRLRLHHGFSIGQPFLLIGLTMLLFGAFRHRPLVFWPPMLAVIAYNIAYWAIAQSNRTWQVR